MSGNFVQRGEPAIIDKYKRTYAALNNGIDIVIELPVYFATSSAGIFASAVIKLLNRSNIVDYVCFGSESGNLDRLCEISSLLKSNQYAEILSNSKNTGRSFPFDREQALKLLNPDTSLQSPNDTLAVEYLNSIDSEHSSMKPVAVKRKSAEHHSSAINEISSASAIRKRITEGGFQELEAAVPIETFSAIKKVHDLPANPIDCMSQILQYVLACSNHDELRNILDVSEGLENRIINQSVTHYRISDLILAIKTKRYTYTRIQRVLLHIILNLSKSDFELFNAEPRYLRVLGFRKESAHLLHDMENRAGLPVITNIKNAYKVLDVPSMKMLEKEIEVTDIYNVCMYRSGLGKGAEYKEPLVIV